MSSSDSSQQPSKVTPHEPREASSESDSGSYDSSKVKKEVKNKQFRKSKGKQPANHAPSGSSSDSHSTSTGSSPDEPEKPDTKSHSTNSEESEKVKYKKMVPKKPSKGKDPVAMPTSPSVDETSSDDSGQPKTETSVPRPKVQPNFTSDSEEPKKPEMKIVKKSSMGKQPASDDSSSDYKVHVQPEKHRNKRKEPAMPIPSNNPPSGDESSSSSSDDDTPVVSPGLKLVAQGIFYGTILCPIDLSNIHSVTGTGSWSALCTKELYKSLKGSHYHFIVTYEDVNLAGTLHRCMRVARQRRKMNSAKIWSSDSGVPEVSIVPVPTEAAKSDWTQLQQKRIVIDAFVKNFGKSKSGKSKSGKTKYTVTARLLKTRYNE